MCINQIIFCKPLIGYFFDVTIKRAKSKQNNKNLEQGKIERNYLVYSFNRA